MWYFFTFQINFVDSTSLKWNDNQGNLARPLIHSEKDHFFCCVVFMLILGKEKKTLFEFDLYLIYYSRVEVSWLRN